jgi:hypothetical protein
MWLSEYWLAAQSGSTSSAVFHLNGSGEKAFTNLSDLKFLWDKVNYALVLRD